MVSGEVGAFSIASIYDPVRLIAFVRTTWVFYGLQLHDSQAKVGFRAFRFDVTMCKKHLKVMYELPTALGALTS